MRETIKKILNRVVREMDLSMGDYYIEPITDEIVKALQNETQTLTCVYCGKIYEPGTPQSNHESLTNHISVCEKHPMFALKKEVEHWKERARTFVEALSYTRRALPCAMSDFLGKELYERCYVPPDEPEEEEESAND